MSTNVERLENSRVKLTVTIDSETLEKAIDEAYRKNVKKINIPGFRKGKAPKNIIELNYGPNVFLEDAIDILLPRVYQESIDETEIQPVDQPSVDIERIERGEGATFAFEVDVYPKIELGEYKGLAVEREIVKITDEDVENVLKGQQSRNAQLVVAEHSEVQEGDFAIIDYVGYVDGKPFSGGAGENQDLEIGSGRFIPGFEEQLIGLGVGETKEIEVTFPEEYHSKELAGKEATFKVTIKELKERSLPDLDDEFAKDLGDFDTLDELKADIRKNLEDDASRRTTEQVENKLLEQIAEKSTVEIPQSMIDHQAMHLLDYFLENVQRQGLNPEQYLQMTGQTKEELRAEFEPQAKTQIINDLIIEAVNGQEGISVSDEEVNDQIEEYMSNSGELEPEMEKTMRDYWNSQRKGIEMSIERKKVLDFIVEQAQITDVEAAVEPAETE